MFYKIITGNRIETVLIIFLMAVGIWMPAFLSPEIITERFTSSMMPFYSIMSKVLAGHILASKLLAFGLLLVEALLLVRINARFVLVQQRTLLPALFFVLIASHSPVLLQWNPIMPAALFVIIILNFIFRSYKDEPDSYRYFEAGLLLGLGSMFYAPLAYLLVFIWFASMAQRPFYWREYLFPLLGLLVPFVLYLSFLFLADKSISEFIYTLKSNFTFRLEFPEYSWIYWVFATYLALMIIVATVYLLSVFQFRKIYIRDYFMVLFWLFIISDIIFLFFSGINTGITYLIAISVSYMLANYFINAKKSIWNKLLLYFLIWFSVILVLNNLFGWIPEKII